MLDITLQKENTIFVSLLGEFSTKKIIIAAILASFMLTMLPFVQNDEKSLNILLTETIQCGRTKYIWGIPYRTEKGVFQGSCPWGWYPI